MKTLTPKTHIGKVRQQNLTQIERVCELLNWTREQFCKHQYSQYEAFVKRACADLPEAANYLRYSKTFRGFFNHEWMIRTAAKFLPFATDMTMPTLELLKQVWNNGDVTLEGVEYSEGLPYGAAYLVEEYVLIHKAQRLFYDEAFAQSYANIIDLILTHKGNV